MTPIPATESAIHLAADLLRAGKLVAFPTETVYGLGADAANPSAVAKIFAAKGRPTDHPLIVHIADKARLGDWASTVPDAAWRLAEQFWPGPLTLILPKAPQVPDAVTGGQETVALRVPANPVALQLLSAFGGGVAAPSANRFGRNSPTQASHVADDLGDAVDCILDGGACEVGVESTILDLSVTSPVLLRPGRIARSQLEKALGTAIALKPQHEIRAPGMMAIHYAPRTPAYLCSQDQLPARLDESTAQQRRLGVLLRQTELPAEYRQIPCIRLPQSAALYEQALYSALRALDTMQLDLILIEQPPEDEIWQAVTYRLSKAALSL